MQAMADMVTRHCEVVEKTDWLGRSDMPETRAGEGKRRTPALFCDPLVTHQSSCITRRLVTYVRCGLSDRVKEEMVR